MPKPYQHTSPLIVAGPGAEGPVSRPQRLQRKTAGDAVGGYSEAWLQRLIHAHPELLPISAIEPAFQPAVPVCLELRTPRGYVDNFYVTPSGNLIFAECKLWRNAEARREVVAQVMDYVEGLTSWSYEELEVAARGGDESSVQSWLYELVSAAQELEEKAFIDAVSRNLRLGRGLFLIVGDGIREGTETLVDHLQAHAGLHFALSLVELALFRLPGDGGVLVQPRVIARTVNIERGIVRIDDGRVSITEAAVVSGASGRAQSLSEEEFYQRIGEKDPELPDRLRAFVEQLEPLGVTPEFKKTLILRWRDADGTALNVGYIETSGRMWTDAVNWNARALDILDITHDYVQELADAVGGDITWSTSDQDSCRVTLGGPVPRIGQLLAHEDAWVQALEHLGRRVRERLASREE